MLQYIIDGFNLAHKISSLKKSSNIHQDLVNYIKNHKLTGSRNNKVLIVFDGKPNRLSTQEKEFKIIFSDQKSADELIAKRLENMGATSEVVVVSDDLEVKRNAKDQGARVCGTAEFIKTKKKDVWRSKDIDYTLQREITEELRKIWLGE